MGTTKAYHTCRNSLSRAIAMIPDRFDPSSDPFPGRIPADFAGFSGDDLTVHPWNLFERVVASHGGRIAVSDGKGDLSYTALHQSVVRLEGVLPDLPPERDHPVWVMLANDRWFATVVMVLIRRGLPFVPLDANISGQKLKLTLSALERPVILTTRAQRDALGGALENVHWLLLEDLEQAGTAANPKQFRPLQEEICQVLTSGTTGVPNRVRYTARMISHDVVVRTNALRFAPSDVFAQWLSGTSLPLMTLFLALLNGARICCRDIKGRDRTPLAEWIGVQEISILRLTPSLLRIIASEPAVPGQLDAVRLVSSGGEPLFRADLEQFNALFSDDAVLLNHLSATEYRVACQYLMPRGFDDAPERIPVGYPLPGYDLRLVDDAGREAADGEPGEIVIRSRYVAPGYFDSSRGCWENFPLDSNSDEIVLRTGDIGSRNDRGCFALNGRRDNMVKIRGNRVELDALEGLFRALDSVEDACACAQNSGDNVTLFLSGPGPLPALGESRQLVYGQLGLFGVPGKVVYLDQLPMTHNGKIDRNLLSQRTAD